MTEQLDRVLALIDSANDLAALKQATSDLAMEDERRAADELARQKQEMQKLASVVLLIENASDLAVLKAEATKTEPDKELPAFVLVKRSK